MSPRSAARKRFLLRLLLMIVVLGVAAWVLTPKTREAFNSAHQLHHVGPGWLVLAFAGQVGSVVAFSLVTRSLLSPGTRLSFRRTFRIDLVTIALSHAVPAGSAAGTALGYGLLAEEGVGRLESAFVKVTQSLLSGLLLQLLLGLALALQLAIYGPDPTTIGVAAVGAVLIVLAVGTTGMIAYREAATRTLARTLLRRIRRIQPDEIDRVVSELSARTRGLLTARGRLLWTCTWSLGNWILDLLCLWASLRAFGAPPNIVLLTAAFCVVQVAAAIPISPGGLGVVEGSLIPILIGVGTSSPTAVLGVFVWRLFNYWLALPVGAVAYVAIVIERHRRTRFRSSTVARG